MEARCGARRGAGVAVAFALAVLPWFVTAAGDAEGFIYGVVVTNGGASHEGRLRWADEEAFWGDLFHASKPAEARSHLDSKPADARRGKPIKVFGLTVGFHSDNDGSRQLVARFGDLAAIHPRGSDGAKLVLRSGTEYEVEGGSNDLGATIHVRAANGDEVEIPWRTIDRIELRPAPPDLAVREHRLHGTVATRSGTFHGFIQWDQHEALSSDKLDGEDEGRSVALEMGSIRSIERTPAGSRVTLRAGDVLELDGTNDVNDENRGIYVDDDRYGRVLVSWDVFERVDFSEPGPSGAAYGEFPAGRPLTGRVTTKGGATHTGRIAYDLDESESWELLDGGDRGIDYSIPMGTIAAIVPGSRQARVVLKSGEELELGGAADVGEDNDGIAIVAGDGRVAYVPWSEVARVDFD